MYVLFRDPTSFILDALYCLMKSVKNFGGLRKMSCIQQMTISVRVSHAGGV